MKLIITIVTGLLATIATEYVVGAWFNAAPSHWPLISSYWTLTALPAISLVVIISTLLLWRIFATGKLLYPFAFGAAYMVGFCLELHMFGNPPQTILKYVLVAFVVCLVVLGGLYKLRWKFS